MNKQVKKDLIQALYDIGGCDAEDEWSRGYDDGVNAAIEVIKELKVHGKVIFSHEEKFVADWLNDLRGQISNVKLNSGAVFMTFIGRQLERYYDEEYSFLTEKIESWLTVPKNKVKLLNAIDNGYEVEKEQLYWAVRGVTDYFRCDEKIIVFKKEEEALEVANLIGINTEVKKMNSIDCSECISIEELRNENEEPLFYVALPKIGDTEFCYLWTDTDGAVYTQGNKGLCIGRLKHTEQEIKSIDERYWPFAVKVDGE